MSRKIEYVDAPPEIQESLDNAVSIDDFLPSPEHLIRRQKKEKVTIMLNGNVVDYFRTQAARLGGKYQTMINDVLDEYTIRAELAA
jgi:uncharacterized protein (DUF4415 family)